MGDSYERKRYCRREKMGVASEGDERLQGVGSSKRWVNHPCAGKCQGKSVRYFSQL